MQPVTDDDLLQLTQQLAHTLLARNWQLATAESCTGGWLAKCCTDIPGSSQWFERGLVTYSNQAKQALLHVRTQTLECYGAVSEYTAREMAEGVLALSPAHIGVAITGIAGPEGGSVHKPVGTVCFAWSDKLQGTRTATHHFTGDRDAIRRQSVICALHGLIKNARDSGTDMG